MTRVRERRVHRDGGGGRAKRVGAVDDPEVAVEERDDHAIARRLGCERAIVLEVDTVGFGVEVNSVRARLGGDLTGCGDAVDDARAVGSLRGVGERKLCGARAVGYGDRGVGG